MKHAFLTAVASALVVTVASAAPLTPEQTLNRRTIGELEFSPDGSRLAFTVTDPVKGAARQRNIWLLDVASGRLRQLTFSAKSDSSPRWAPDGQSLAFLSTRDSARDSAAQLFLLPMRGGEAEQLVDRADGISAFRWSPDGRQIALLMAEAKPAAQQQREKDKDDSRVAEKDDRLPRVWMLDLPTHALRPLTSARFRIGQIEWLPEGDRLIAAASPRPEADAFNEGLYAVDTHDGAFTPIAAPHGPMGGFALSPDGRTIAYVGARRDGPEAHDLWLQPVGGGAATNLSGASLDRPVSQLHWADARTIAATVQRGFKSAIALVTTDAHTRLLDGIDVNPSAFARSAANVLAYVGETAARAPELWIKKGEAAASPITSFNEVWHAIPVVVPELVTYKSGDGTSIEAALLRPAAGRQPWPLVALVHGGPTGRWSDSFEPWGQLLAARGYAVLYPNVRGSTGYGHAFVEMNRADWGGGDFTDVMAGVDAMIARGVADPNRLGIGGWSYGGYMAAWAVTQTNRFKASVSGAPVIDMASEFGTENGSAYDEWFYGTPYEKLEGFVRSSPITHVKNAKTPTLLLQGEEDTTDPVGQSQQFYRGLKRYGVETELVLYPREPHGLREEKHLLDRLNRIVAWYDKHLEPGTTLTEPRR